MVKTPSFRDEKVQQGKTYIYGVTAVDTHGNEGPAAEAALEVR
jgi:fibronectin type 3 domain-containing protein